MDALLVGLGETNVAVARELLAHGDGVVVIDDRPTDASRAAAAAKDVRLSLIQNNAPTRQQLISDSVFGL